LFRLDVVSSPNLNVLVQTGGPITIAGALADTFLKVKLLFRVLHGDVLEDESHRFQLFAHLAQLCLAARSIAHDFVLAIVLTQSGFVVNERALVLDETRLDLNSAEGVDVEFGALVGLIVKPYNFVIEEIFVWADALRGTELVTLVINSAGMHLSPEVVPVGASKLDLGAQGALSTGVAVTERVVEVLSYVTVKHGHTIKESLAAAIYLRDVS